MQDSARVPGRDVPLAGSGPPDRGAAQATAHLCPALATGNSLRHRDGGVPALAEGDS